MGVIQSIYWECNIGNMESLGDVEGAVEATITSENCDDSVTANEQVNRTRSLTEKDMYSWCDFCIYTCKGFSLQRILPDTEWQKSKIPELEPFFDCFMLPELVCPKYKPRYIV